MLDCIIKCWKIDYFENSLKCLFYATGQQSNTTVKIDFGDGHYKTYVIKNSLNSHIGGEIPFLEFKSTLSFGGRLLLINTEAKFSSILYGIRFIASNSGSIFFQIVSFGSICGNLKSCSEYLSLNRNTNGMYNLYSSTLVVKKGLNVIMFENAIKLPKGSIILVDMTSSNIRLLCDESGSVPYSDFSINQSVLNMLYPSRNLKIYFNLLIENEFYETIHHFEYNYKQRKNYKLIGIIKDNNKQISQTIQFKKKQFLDIYCRNSNKTIDYKIHCYLIMLSQDLDDSVELDDNIFNFTGKIFNFFGIESPDFNYTIETTNLTGSFVLPNTEFKFDTDFIGFETFAVNTGLLTISVNF
ncbi:unnamed protein product [Brachionus calyciflorus]|uniref:Uncharacterized protein n=1 Tax=Brachionus calyciflorus TaxID=104777 RepID=A0A813UFI1_9BILA|nr:unnamed protein product [Brachionus calyciflorus]